MKKIISAFNSMINGLDFCSPAVDFVVRVYVALIFWQSGLAKFATMDSTIWLFANEYKVPVLSPVVAAYLATGSEIVFSFLLIIGLFSRFSALSLLIVNEIALLTFPNLPANAVQWHLVWALLLLIPIFHGPGKLSCDYFIWKKLSRGETRTV